MSAKRGKHTSARRELQRCIRLLEASPLVRKVVLGVYTNARHHYPPGTLRFQRFAPGGVVLKAYDGNGLMDVYVKVANASGFLKTCSGRRSEG